MPSTYEPLATTTLGSAAQSITFSTIPTTYTDLRLVLTTTGLSGSDYIFLQYNGDGYPSQNFSSVHLYGGGASAGSFQWTNAYGIYANGIGAVSTTPNVSVVFDIFDYRNAYFKTCLLSYATDNNGSGYIGKAVGLWRSTSAITSVTLQSTGGSVTFNTGTKATLFGIKAA